MTLETNTYDQFAEQYATLFGGRDESDIAQDPIASRLLEIIGNVEDLSVLDAGCGEGYLSRALASHGAQVTGIDISPRLVEMARARDPKKIITYQVGDLSKPWPQYGDRFDLGAPCSPFVPSAAVVRPCCGSRPWHEVNIRDYHSGYPLPVDPSNGIAGGR